MTQEQVKRAKLGFKPLEVKVFDLVICSTKSINDLQDKLYKKLEHHWNNDMTTKIFDFDGTHSGFAIETLPTCSTASEFKLRCLLLLKGLKNEKKNNILIQYIFNKYDFPKFFMENDVKVCQEHSYP